MSGSPNLNAGAPTSEIAENLEKVRKSKMEERRAVDVLKSYLERGARVDRLLHGPEAREGIPASIHAAALVENLDERASRTGPDGADVDDGISTRSINDAGKGGASSDIFRDLIRRREALVV